MERLVVIGADAAGMSAASKARRLTKGLEIVAFERGRYASYAACGMPYWIGGQVPARSRLIARTPEAFAERGIDVRLRHEVLEIDAKRRRVRVRDLDAGRERSEPWDHLLVATGARPLLPSLPGVDLEGIHVLKSLEDGERLQAAAKEARRAVIVGSGYVGVEVAESLCMLGVETQVLEVSEQVLPNLDPPASALAIEALTAHGVQVHLGTEATAFEGTGRVRRVVTTAGTLEADLVVVAVGLKPNAELARAAGVPCGFKGGIVTDARMATAVPGVWAAGDCCQALHRVTEQATWIPLGDTANRMGRVAGTNLGGGHAVFRGVAGTAVTRIFDRGFARTGLSRREAEAAGIDFDSTHVDDWDKPRYMPDARPVRVVLNWEKRTGRVVGAQVVAQGEAVKRIDALAVAILARWTLEDLAQADLAYAPPFSPVWDPILVAANVALGG